MDAISLRRYARDDGRFVALPAAGGRVVNEYRVDVVRSGDELARHATALQTLVDNAIEDNAYMAPGFLLPLLRHHGDAHPLLVALVWSGELLVACAPMSRLPASRRTPLPSISTAITPHGRVLHPLLHRTHAAAALRALWDWLERPEHSWHLVLLEHVSTTSPFWTLLQAELARRGARSWVREVQGRPMLRRKESFEAYLAELPARRRKGWRRRLRELESRGSHSFHIHRDLELVPDLAARFMALERKSWKGASGTALDATDRDRAFFTETVAAFAAQKALFFVELRCGDETIAMTSNFVAGRSLFAFKIAYDPAFAQFSPGVLVELEGIRRFHEETNLVIADSGSGPDSYVRAYFRDVADMQWLCVATPRIAARAFMRVMPVAVRIKDTYASSMAYRRSKRAQPAIGASPPSRDRLADEGDEIG